MKDMDRERLYENGIQRPVEQRASQRYHSRSRRLARSLIAFFVTFILTFLIINSGSLWSRVWYWWQTDVQKIHPGAAQEKVIAGENSRLPTVVSTLAPNRLTIPKIGVDAPVIWNSDPQRLLQDLARGVAHYKGTARPNDRSGNVFITGHSSNFIWDKGQYNRVFANLDKLVVGDLIALTTDKKEFVYQVKDKIVIKPSELNVLNPTTSPTLSLMTCVPVGTNLLRLIVHADLVKSVPLQ